jgi:hypothetical protein
VRPLSERQAAACESAKTSRCRCRCGGVCHGAARGDLSALPKDDPHAPAPPKPPKPVQLSFAPSYDVPMTATGAAL